MIVCNRHISVFAAKKPTDICSAVSAIIWFGCGNSSADGATISQPAAIIAFCGAAATDAGPRPSISKVSPYRATSVCNHVQLFCSTAWLTRQVTDTVSARRYFSFVEMIKNKVRLYSANTKKCVMIKKSPQNAM